MTRWLGICLALYAPHLLEEALTQMHDDPIIVTAFQPLSELSARHATYLVFQITLALSLGMLLLYALGGRYRLVVMLGVALSLVGESHHVLRAIATLHINPGLITSLPMPIVGAIVFRKVLAAWSPVAPALTTASRGEVFS